MTNLLEKSLLLGFSIFLLTVFSVILIPFLDELTKYSENEKGELEIYMEFLDEINEAVLLVIQNPEKSYLQDILYPSNINLTFFDAYILSEFLIGGKIYNKVLSYNASFHNCFYRSLPSLTYVLNVSYPSSYIIVNFLNLY